MTLKLVCVLLPVASRSRVRIVMNSAGEVDIVDLPAAIDNLFINFTPLPACQ